VFGPSQEAKPQTELSGLTAVNDMDPSIMQSIEQPIAKPPQQASEAGLIQKIPGGGQNIGRPVLY